MYKVGKILLYLDDRETTLIRSKDFSSYLLMPQPISVELVF